MPNKSLVILYKTTFLQVCRSSKFIWDVSLMILDVIVIQLTPFSILKTPNWLLANFRFFLFCARKIILFLKYIFFREDLTNCVSISVINNNYFSNRRRNTIHFIDWFFVVWPAYKIPTIDISDYLKVIKNLDFLFNLGICKYT